jgi:hypothetical protein
MKVPNLWKNLNLQAAMPRGSEFNSVVVAKDAAGILAHGFVHKYLLEHLNASADPFGPARLRKSNGPISGRGACA